MTWKMAFYSGPRPDIRKGLVHLKIEFTEPMYGDRYAVDVIVKDDPVSVAGALEEVARAMRRQIARLSL